MRNDLYDYLKIGLFILIGIVVGFLLWHPSNNDYVNKTDYNSLSIKYDNLAIENEQLKSDMAGLITEFYTKSFIFDIIGLRKHQRAFCAIQKYITGEIPVLSELIC